MASGVNRLRGLIGKDILATKPKPAVPKAPSAPNASAQGFTGLDRLRVNLGADPQEIKMAKVLSAPLNFRAFDQQDMKTPAKPAAHSAQTDRALAAAYGVLTPDYKSMTENAQADTERLTNDIGTLTDQLNIASQYGSAGGMSAAQIQSSLAEKQEKLRQKQKALNYYRGKLSETEPGLPKVINDNSWQALATNVTKPAASMLKNTLDLADYAISLGSENPTAGDTNSLFPWVKSLDDYVGNTEKTFTNIANTTNAAAGKGAATVGQLVGGTVAALPSAVLAYVTRGKSLAGTVEGLAGTSAIEAAGNAGKLVRLTETARQAVTQWAKDPQYWYSFVQSAGSDYNQAIANGASQDKAMASSLVSGLINSAIEMGGIQELPKELQNKDAKGIAAWVDTMLDEGKEEPLQSIITNLTAKVVYNKNAPAFSTTDQNAVINPVQAGQDFLGGAVAGGILGGGEIAADRIFSGGTRADAEPAPSAKTGLANAGKGVYDNNGGEINGQGIYGQGSSGDFGASQERSNRTGLDSGRLFRQGDSRVYPRLSVSGRDANTQAVYELDPAISQSLKKAGVDTAPAYLIASPEAFTDAIKTAKQNNVHGTYVTAHTPEEYAGMKKFLLDNGAAGVAVTKDGDIVSVFRDNQNGKLKKASTELLLIALENGGVKLDNFDGALSRIYGQHGFVPVAKTAFNREFAPEDWNYARDGEPDIIFWRHNGDSPAVVAQKRADGSYPRYDMSKVPKFASYDEAAAYRDSLIDGTGGGGKGLPEATKQTTMKSGPRPMEIPMNKAAQSGAFPARGTQAGNATSTQVQNKNDNIIHMQEDAPGTIKTGITAQGGVTGWPGASSIDTNIPHNGSGVNEQGNMGVTKKASEQAMEKSGPKPMEIPMNKAAQGTFPTGATQAQNVTSGKPADQVSAVANSSDNLKDLLRSNHDNLQEIKPVAELNGTEFPKGQGKLIDNVTAFFNRIGNKVTRSDLGDIILNKAGVKDSLYHGFRNEKAIAFAAVPDVLKSGIIINHEFNWKNRGYETYTIAAPVTVGNDTWHVGAIVLKDSQTQRFYLHEVLMENDKGNALPITSGTAKNGGSSSDNALPIDTNIPQNVKGVNEQGSTARMQKASNTEITGKAAEHLGKAQRELASRIVSILPEAKDAGKELIKSVVQELTTDYMDHGSISPETVSRAFYSIAETTAGETAFRDETRAAFEKAVNDALPELRNVRRYVEEASAKARAKAEDIDFAKGEMTPEKVQDVLKLWKTAKEAKKATEKAVARNLMTDADNALVDRLLRGEITLKDLPEDVNAKGIKEIYEARKAEKAALEPIIRYNINRKAALRTKAE